MRERKREESSILRCRSVVRKNLKSATPKDNAPRPVYGERKWPPVKTRPTLAPAPLAAHSACHVCRINNVGLHFYDVPPNGCYAVIYSSRGFRGITTARGTREQNVRLISRPPSSVVLEKRAELLYPLGIRVYTYERGKKFSDKPEKTSAR